MANENIKLKTKAFSLFSLLSSLMLLLLLSWLLLLLFLLPLLLLPLLLLMKTKLINLKQQLAGLTLATWAESKRFGHPWRMSHFNSSQLLCSMLYKFISNGISYTVHILIIFIFILLLTHTFIQCILVTPTLWLWLSCHAYVIIPWLAKAIRKANVGQMFATCKQALSAEIHLLDAGPHIKSSTQTQTQKSLTHPKIVCKVGQTAVWWQKLLHIIFVLFFLVRMRQ